MADRKKQSRFFDRMIKEHGKDFLQVINPDQIRRNANALFKDMAFGSIDKVMYGGYFANTQFMEVLIAAADMMAYEFCVHANGNNLMMQYCPQNDTRFNEVVQKDATRAYAYTMIRDGLINIRNTGNLAILDVIASNIRYARNSL